MKYIYEYNINPDKINLKSFYNKNQLNPKIWDKNAKIKDRIRNRLLNIAKEFITGTDIEFIPVDIVIVGSIAGFNWSKYSDIDLHIIADFKKINDDVDLVKNYFNAKKIIWNDKHKDLNIFKYDVELYVLDVTEENASNGIYSLKHNTWIKIPQKLNLNLKQDIIKQTAALYINKAEYYNKKFYTLKNDKSFLLLQQKVEYLYDLIVQGRKTALAEEGESAAGNIIFKVLRRSGHLGMLNELKTKLYDKINSIEETYQIDKSFLLTESLTMNTINKPRLIRELLYYELVELSNSDIISYCIHKFKLTKKLKHKLEQLYYEDLSKKEIFNIIDLLIEELYNITGIRIRYGKWILNKNDIYNLYDNNDEDINIVVLLDLGSEGVLVGLDKQ